MADKKKDKKKKNTIKKDKKRLKISAVGIVDNIVFSKTDIYAFYKVRTEVFDFLSRSAKVSVAAEINNAFISLMGSRQEPLDLHIITTSSPYDTEAWEQQILQTSSDWDKPEGFQRFLDKQYNHLVMEAYQKRVSYVGVHLGKRGALNMQGLNFLESGIESAIDTMKTWLATTLQTPTEAISAKEERDARLREKEIFRTINNGRLAGERITSLELLTLIKNQFYPAMETPYVNVDPDTRVGPGDLALESASVIENKYRWLKITQMLGNYEVTGYRANLTLAKFEKNSVYPDRMPFFYLPAFMGANLTTYARISLTPNSKMKNELEKKKKEQKDEFENLAGGQDEYDTAMGDVPNSLVEALNDRQMMEELLNDDNTPWITGSFHIVVESDTEESLKDFCSRLQQVYKNENITLHWNAGDQAELFLEQMPGDKLRSKSFNQTATLSMLSTSGFSFSSDVGDPIFGNE